MGITVEIEDQLDKDGNVVDKIAVITRTKTTENVERRSRTDLLTMKTRLEREIAPKKKRIEEIETILEAVNGV